MNIGDKIIIWGVEYTIWFIEDNIYHFIDDNGDGKCATIEWIESQKDK